MRIAAAFGVLGAGFLFTLSLTTALTSIGCALADDVKAPATAAGALHQSPHRREWPVTERDRAALDMLDAQGVEIAKAKAEISEREKKLAARYEAVVADIKSSCVGIRADEVLQITAKRDLFYVEDAPGTSH